MNSSLTQSLAERIGAISAHSAVPSSLFDAPGPFCTVYLDASRVTENGAHEVELRWRAAREELAGAGASDADLQALADAVDADASTPGRHGLVLVASGGQLRWSGLLPDPPRRAASARSALPHLLPYLAQEAHRVPHVVVVADRRGADVFTVGAASGVTASSTEGSAQHPIHRTGRNEWDERKFQNTVENAWETNANDVAEEVATRATRCRARLIVLAGDPRARTLIRDALAASRVGSVAITELETGGRAAGSDEAALAEGVREAVLSQVRTERRDLLSHLQQNLGRHSYAVAGVPAVIDALRKAQVDTVVLSDDPSSTVRAAIGPAATDLALTEEDLLATGVEAPQWDRFDAALVRAVIGTGATLVVTPQAHKYVQDGIAALLRYDDSAG